MQVRLFRPSVGEEELESIREAFDRAWLGLGPKVSEFEQAWSRYVDVPMSLGVNSATAALHLAMGVFGFSPGSKVLVTALTFVASATCILHNRLEPVFVDVDPETLSMSFEDLERKVGEDCVAIVAVHYGGHPIDMDRLMAFAHAHNLRVIEDCAHCPGGEWRTKKLGTLSDIGCYSFEEKKGMTTGDGGMLSAHDSTLLEPLRARRWVGIDKDTWKRAASYIIPDHDDPRHWYYEVAELGFKYNMNDLMASIGLVQLRRLDAMNVRRRQIIQRYLDGIAELQTIQPLFPYALANSCYWIMGVRCEDRDGLILHLKHRGIATGVHYMPLPMHPLFKGYHAEIPVAERLWPTILTLPLYVDMTNEEIDYVLDGLHSFKLSSATH